MPVLLSIHFSQSSNVEREGVQNYLDTNLNMSFEGKGRGQVITERGLLFVPVTTPMTSMWQRHLLGCTFSTKNQNENLAGLK